MRKAIVAFLLFLFCLPLFSKGPKIEDIYYSFDNQHLYVSVSLQKGFLTQEVLDALDSTKPTTFTYEIEVAKSRLLWYDKTTHRVVVKKTFTYDNLTHQYELSVIKNDEPAEKKSLTSIDEVEKEISRLDDLDAGSIADLMPGENLYYIRVRVTLLKSYFLWLFPADVDTGWKEKALKTP